MAERLNYNTQTNEHIGETRRLSDKTEKGIVKRSK